MTTYQGIAATTWTLYYLAGSAARAAVPEANVTLDPPEQQPAASRGEPRLNIYLVQAVPHPAMRSMDLPTRGESGALVTAPQVALNLRYLLSFFGPSIKAHLMLGSVEIALREHAVFDPALITTALTGQPDLQGSGLDAQSPQVQIAPKPMTLEELARFWSGFFQIPYALSAIYEASVVVIESALIPTVTLPVRTINLTVAGLAPQLGPLPAVDYRPGELVPVSGTGLSAGQLVEIAGQWVPLQAAAPSGLAFGLPSAVPAGVHLVRLGAVGGAAPGETVTAGPFLAATAAPGVSTIATTSAATASAAATATGTAPPGAAVPAPVPGSAAQPLVVRPMVDSGQFDQAGAQVTVTISPVPGAAQPVALSLFSLQPDATGQPSSLRLATPSSRTGSSVSFPTPTLPPGPYLVIVEVDGVASSPIFRGDQYDQPQVQIS